jgi:ubiquitin carboxyl-terminal hydrolase 16/45
MRICDQESHGIICTKVALIYNRTFSLILFRFSPIFSCADKGSTLFRLAAVVVHIGMGSLKSGHYIAYVRARKLGCQQEEASWFCADDSQIRRVTIEQVLNSQAYILFYERMEDQDVSGMTRQN